jgi:hypothetical protein
MKRLGNNWLLVACGAAALAGCGSGTVNHDAGGSGGSSGSGGSTGSGGSGLSTTEVTITPDGTGWVDAMADGNSLMVQGAWYGYGDQYGEICTDAKLSGMKCNDPLVGNHPTSDCSVVKTPTLPADPAVGFPPTDAASGKMCTTGTIAKVVAIVNTSLGTGMDYSNIWGAGIGLDLAAMKAAGACDAKGTFAAKDKHVIGMKFDIDMVPAVGLRVEFPIPDTDGTKNGSDYWGATSAYPNSPVVAGTNTIYWDPASLGITDVTVKGVTPAGSTPTVTFDPNKMESIQFHVPAGTSSAYPADYSFCISNLKLLVQQ